MEGQGGGEEESGEREKGEEARVAVAAHQDPGDEGQADDGQRPAAHSLSLPLVKSFYPYKPFTLT